jgi:hypothetical protein
MRERANTFDYESKYDVYTWTRAHQATGRSELSQKDGWSTCGVGAYGKLAEVASSS